MAKFDHFDFLAPFYEKFIQPKDPEFLWDLLELPTEGRFLDAGGGTGRVAQFMRGKVGSVIVADLSCKMLTETAEKVDLSPVCSPSENLPFPDSSFARIIMVDALHHVIHQKKTLAELWRLLQPGGILVIEEPDIGTFPVKLIAIAEKLALMRSHFLSPKRILEFLSFADAQVRIEKEETIAFIVAKKAISPT